MTFAELMTAMRSAAKELFLELEIPLEQPNVVLDTDGLERFAKMTVLPGEKTQASCGQNPRFRLSGVTIFQLFVPGNTGDGAINELVDEVGDRFTACTIDGVVFRAAYPEVIGASGGRYQVNAVCPWYADHIRENES